MSHLYKLIPLSACVLLLSALWGCDTALAPSASEALPKGPHISAFPQSTLVSPEGMALDLPDAQARAASGASAQKDSPVLVPLVLDGAGRLHSPQSFRVALAQVDEKRERTPEVRFTDLATFQRTIKGSSFESLYAGGRRGRIGDVEVFDPYVTPNLVPPPPCEPGDDFCDEGGGGGGGGGTGGGGGPTQPYRPSSDVSATYASAPVWPQVWVGDVISGEKSCGSSSSSQSCGSGGSSGGSSGGFSNLGHSLLITQLNNGQRWGGNYLDDATFSMEAIGDRPNPADEVVERPARTWFDDPGLRYAHVMYHRMATWTEREATVAFARAQDPDPYDAFTTKTSEDAWYCSKLVWRAYRVTTGDSLDPDWGFWVFPSDLEASGHLVSVYHYRRS